MPGLATVGSYLHRDEAEIACARLGAEGIAARVVADDEGGLNPGFFAEYRIRIEVRVADRAAALVLLHPDLETIALPEQIRGAIVAHAEFCAPLEACGLLAFDQTGKLRMAYCLTNVDQSVVRFTVSPAEHLKAMLHAERNGWIIGGAFHSHPEAQPLPSPTDVAGALEPSWLYVIAGPLTEPDVRGYRIAAGSVDEVVLEIGGGQGAVRSPE